MEEDELRITTLKNRVARAQDCIGRYLRKGARLSEELIAERRAGVSRIVLDASAILAVLGQEPGSAMFLSHLGNTAVGTVNLAEAHGKLVSRGVPEKDAWEGARSLAAEVVDFDREQARLVGTLASQNTSARAIAGRQGLFSLGNGS
jgi:PIN domain nuclease of toxin-antitoxin system